MKEEPQESNADAIGSTESDAVSGNTESNDVDNADIADSDADSLNADTEQEAEASSSKPEFESFLAPKAEEEESKNNTTAADDVVASGKKKDARKVKIVIFVVLLTIMALLIGGYFGLRSAVENAYEEQQAESGPEGPEAPVEQLPETEAPVEVEEGTNVFDSLYSGEASPYDGSEEVELGNDRFVLSGSQVMLEADEGELAGGDTVDCVLADETDICYAGSAEFDDLEDIEIYAVKNIVENRLFERMEDAETITVVGAETAVTGNLPFGVSNNSDEDDGDTVNMLPVFAIAAENGSGFMLLFGPGSEGTLEDMREAYAPEFTVHND